MFVLSYLNGVTGYRKDLLANRSVVKKGNYAVIEPDGIVKNTIPGFENCDITILATPRLGATFCDYVMTIHAGGKNLAGFGKGQEEVIFYLMEGELSVTADKEYGMTTGGYVYCPPGTSLKFENKSGKDARAFLYKRIYEPIEGHKPHVVTGNMEEKEWAEYEGMADVLVKDFLPTNDLAFDCNLHILSFKPGACHGYIETHYQEHGAYCLSGEGVYYLDDTWIPCKKGDYLFMGAYCPQACYAVGRGEPFAYVYSKDCNRDPQL